MRAALLLATVSLTVACGAPEPSAGSALPTTLAPTTLAPAPPESGPSPTAVDVAWVRPPFGGYFDYQLSGDYPPPAEVLVVARDWFSGTPEPGLYNICYVNAFQTQPPDDADRPDEREGWPAEVVLAVEDPEWPGEFVIDLSTPEMRASAAAHVQQMIDTCADKGFDAVEFDNLDSYTRFDDLPFGQAETLDYAATIAGLAHASGLAVGQKNTVELTREQSLEQVGFDFAVVEECAEFDECAAYRSVFDLQVLSIEYTQEGMVAACEQFGVGVPVLRRDLNLVTPDDPAYEFETYCGFRGYG